MIYDIIRIMSKKERVKVTIDILKAVILALMTALFGIFGFIVVHLYSLKFMQVLMIVAGIAILAIFFYLSIKYLKKLLDELEVM